MVRLFRKRGFRLRRSPQIFEPSRQKKEIKTPEFNFSLLKYVFWSGAFLIVLYIMFYSPIFRVEDIIVEGNEIILKEQIEKEIPDNQNIFLLNTRLITNKIKNDIPEIKDVRIYKGIPDALKITVSEYNKALVWKTSNKYYLISNQGQVYKEINGDLSEYSNIPVVEDKKNLEISKSQIIITPSFVAFVTNIQNGLKETVNLEADYFSVEETTVDVNCYTKSGIYVKFDSMRSSQKQLDNLKTIMVEKSNEIHEYVDVRVDGWGYYK